MLPLVSIVGRPNVGKSTLVNRLISSREAIVQEEPGVTRDRNYYETEWRGRRFNLVDTGGLDPGTRDALSAKMGDQARYAIRESDLVLLLVDAQDGFTPADEEVVEILRGMDKPIILVVNKVDNTRREDALTADFHRAGFPVTVPISALHGLGVGELLDEMVEALPPKDPEEDEEEEEGRPLTIAIVGRPNVGKSSLFNKLIGQDRSLIYEKPGTTRDSVDVCVEMDGEPVVFVDTAGWRRRSRIDNEVEYFSIVRLWRTLDRADVALLVIDATEGVTDQDQRIAARIRDDGLASVVVLNKWDIAKRGRTGARAGGGRPGGPQLRGLFLHPAHLRADRLGDEEHHARGDAGLHQLAAAHPDLLPQPAEGGAHPAHPSALQAGQAAADLLHHPGPHRPARVRLLRQRPRTGRAPSSRGSWSGASGRPSTSPAPRCGWCSRGRRSARPADRHSWGMTA